MTGLYYFPANGDFKHYKNNFEVYDPLNSWNAQNWYTSLDADQQNPYWVLNRNKRTDKRDRFMASGTVKYNITDYLNVQGRLRLDQTKDFYDMKVFATTTSVLAPPNGRYKRETFDAKQFYGDLLVNFNKTFNEQWEVNASAGTSFTDFKTQRLYIDSDKGGLVLPNYFVPENVRRHRQAQSESESPGAYSWILDRIRIGYQPIRLFFTILRRYADMDMNIEMDKNTATDSITSRLADARNDLGITQLSRPLTHQRLPPIPPDYPGLALPRRAATCILPVVLQIRIYLPDPLLKDLH